MYLRYLGIEILTSGLIVTGECADEEKTKIKVSPQYWDHFLTCLKVYSMKMNGKNGNVNINLLQLLQNIVKKNIEVDGIPLEELRKVTKK